jgi:multidrug efflux pump subunit AcrA (membrane-fusion protein)
MGIVRFALRFPHTLYVMAIAMRFLGASAILAAPRDIFPRINIPVVAVVWQYTDNSSEELRAGLYCTVRLSIPRQQPIIVIPSQALVFDDKGLSAALDDHGTARLRHLDIARDDGADVEVRSGLNPGDRGSGNH